jgi:hypothetical protein
MFWDKMASHRMQAHGKQRARYHVDYNLTTCRKNVNVIF